MMVESEEREMFAVEIKSEGLSSKLFQALRLKALKGKRCDRFLAIMMAREREREREKTCRSADQRAVAADVLSGFRMSS